MGVPKFFRYISERYPCLSEILKEYQIPDFDNLYLDMNGIIHMCSHPDDGDPHFRITEEKIFQDIFHYIEVLFRMIKPRQLFFMAVDGVAPRAKMNQQRGRRFRSAKEAIALENKARERGEELPTEERFDSNCITPGTVFMDRLHEQLKYFVVNKISNDTLWQKCKVVLSGQETPGEGEHKIMDYIRYMRAQPGYDPNTRHCLYGLDADLIMLGLCTHEPHFSLLREEVRFGKKSNTRKNIPEQITFYLLHLSLLREYLELEFYPLKDSLKFEYDMEKIIDDWVLMGFLVGNDFIPHLPNMHITEGALPVLYDAYMKVLPKLGGYINESGILNLERFELFISELAPLDLDSFSEKYADLKWFESKTGRHMNDEIENSPDDDATDIMFVEESVQTKHKNSDLSALINQTNALLIDGATDEEQNGLIETNDDDLFTAEFIRHKTDYYRNKLGFTDVTPEVLKSQAEEYVRAIQWILHYYYNGVCSWSWYYPHHYAPYVSDIKNFSDLLLTFNLGEPFMPYEQLLAVLPSYSKALLPPPYQDLMVNETSSIKEFYPEDFKTDLNGKKQEWEAVVLIPFIDEKILLKAMSQCSHLLTPAETARNRHGPMLVYHFTSENLGTYPAPQYFQLVEESHAHCDLISNEDIHVPMNKLIKGPYPDAEFDVYYPGFPTLKHLKYEGVLEKWKVRVFDYPSRGENMILRIINDQEEPLPASAIANELLGRTVHVGWPHLVEGLVYFVSTEEHVYKSTGVAGQYNVEQIDGKRAGLRNVQIETLIEYSRDRLGIDVGEVNILIGVKVLVGRKYTFSNSGAITCEKQWAKIVKPYPLQTIVRNISVYEEKFEAFDSIESVFPIGSTCFMLGQPGYGAIGEVLYDREAKQNHRVKVNLLVPEEPAVKDIIQMDNAIRVRFRNAYSASTHLSISSGLFSRITGTILVSPGQRSSIQSSDTPKINIGLNLKFNKKNEEIPGYSRKEGNTWLYSERAINLVKDYINTFPNIVNYLNLNIGDDVYYEEDLFPTGNVKESLSEITTWINKLPISSIERQVCGSIIADPEVVQRLEEVLNMCKAKNDVVKTMLMQVKPYLLYKPGLQTGNLMPDPTAQFLLFDRVINVREGYSVPLGLTGSIIGIHNATDEKEEDVTFDVFFDKPFEGGLSLNNIPENRVYRMPKPSVINISYGKRLYMEKTNGNIQNVRVQNRNNYVPPQNNINKIQNIKPPVQWAAGCGTQIPPPQNYNPYYGYPTPPPPTFMNPGPNSFVPYKGGGNYFPYGPPQHLVPNYYQPPPPNIQLPPYHSVGGPTNGNIQYEKHVNQFDKPVKKITEQPSSSSDSEYLKRILKIDENKPTTNRNEYFYTAQLLKEFQAHKLGCPNYQHFEVNNKFTAKIMMPDGTFVFGEPAKSKDNAAENAAKEALNIISRTKELKSQTVEVPPVRAANSLKNNTQRPKLNVQAVQAHLLKQVEADKKTNTASSFVPLQAVRNHQPSIPKTTNTVIDSTVPEETQLQEPLQPTKITGSNTPSKRRERKMRLAANFGMGMNK